MSPAVNDLSSQVRGFPRVSGDEPSEAIRTYETPLLSPRERG